MFVCVCVCVVYIYIVKTDYKSSMEGMVINSPGRSSFLVDFFFFFFHEKRLKYFFLCSFWILLLLLFSLRPTQCSVLYQLCLIKQTSRFSHKKTYYIFLFVFVAIHSRTTFYEFYFFCLFFVTFTENLYVDLLTEKTLELLPVNLPYFLFIRMYVCKL